MGTRGRKAIGFSMAALLAAGVVCWSVSMRFEVRKHELSGVPWSDSASDIDGRKFHAIKSGPLEQRLQVPMTDEQYRQWEENGELERNWGFPGVVCWTVGCIVLAVMDELRRRKARSAKQPPHLTAASSGGHGIVLPQPGLPPGSPPVQTAAAVHSSVVT